MEAALLNAATAVGDAAQKAGPISSKQASAGVAGRPLKISLRASAIVLAASPCLRELRAERARDSWERDPREAAICAGEGVRFDIVWSQFHGSWRGPVIWWWMVGSC